MQPGPHSSSVHTTRSLPGFATAPRERKNNKKKKIKHLAESSEKVLRRKRRAGCLARCCWKFQPLGCARQVLEIKQRGMKAALFGITVKTIVSWKKKSTFRCINHASMLKYIHHRAKHNLLRVPEFKQRHILYI